MAVVIRFNTIIVRKSSISGKYPGGIDTYRALYLPKNASYYFEDEHLIVHTSMGEFYGVVDHLVELGFSFKEGDEYSDYFFASQQEGVNASHLWLNGQTVGGVPVCWLRGSPPGFLSDFKSSQFVKHVSVTSCPECGASLGLGAAVEAIDQNERNLGPLCVVHGNPSFAETSYAVRCPYCGKETLFNEYGRLNGT